MSDFSDFINALGGDDFDEVPVQIEEFVEGAQYLNMPYLSPAQYLIVRMGTQIYRKDTLIDLYGEEAGLKRFKETKNEVILALGKGCHAPYTPVFNANSGKWEALNSISQDFNVASNIDNQSTVEYATAPFVEGSGEMVRVTTSLGLVEDVYVGHKYKAYKKNRFYKRNDKKYLPEFIEVNNLSVGDRIGVGLGYDVLNANNIQESHAKLIGYWLGDGMLPTDKSPTINVDFSSEEQQSMNEYISLVSSGKMVKHPTKNMYYIRHYAKSEEVSLAKRYGLWGMRSKTKRIPDAVWASDNRILALVVEKLWQTDGCVYTKNGLTAEFCSVSEQLATDVQRALLRLGVPSTIRSRVPSSNFKSSRAWYVTVTSQECFNKFSEVINLLDHKRTHRLNKQGRVYRRLDGDLYWDRIVSIEPIGDGEYWTTTIPDTGNYIGNGLISANSGKDHVSAIMCAYIVYLLLCLKDPARYYGKPPGNAIDIINVAVNAAQAKNVFFKGFVTIINRSPWFAGKYKAKADLFEFNKSITVHSGHSEREAWEGFNLMFCVLDEISAFNMENTTGHQSGKTAGDIYKMFRGSIDSRFPDWGKVILLSFPRFKGDFITSHYDSVVADKEVVKRSHTFTIHDDLPENVEDNEFTIEWDEDHILRYSKPKTFAFKRPTWEVNPTRSIEDLKIAFLTDPIDALSRFAAMPPDMIDAYFPSREKIEHAFCNERSNIEDGFLSNDFVLNSNRRYFIHVDLAQKHDRCSVAMAHVESWTKVPFVNSVSPRVVVDFVRYWEPDAKAGITVDFSEVRDFIISIKRRGIDLNLVTFDQWHSFEIMQQLNAQGINTDTLSIAKKHYDDFKLAVAEERIVGPNDKKLIEELVKLRIVKDKVDHPRKGYKDISDSVCGALFNAARYTSRNSEEEVDIVTFAQTTKDNTLPDDVIRAPKQDMPEDLRSILVRMI